MDEFIKSRFPVMPDLARHPKHIEMTGFQLSPERRKTKNSDLLRVL